MKKAIFLVSSLIVLTATSCKNKSDEDQHLVPPVVSPAGPNTNSSPQTTVPNNTAPVILPQNGQTAPVNIQPVNIQMPATTPTTTTITPTPAATTKTTVAAGMNPAHGEPGHRCDIPVGSPLNSPAAKVNPTVQTVTTPPTSQNVTTISTPPVIQTTPTTATKTAPGMNPAHGEPGHRCDIAVGAPLNSPKGGTQPVTVNPTNAAPVMLPATTPATKQNN
jgi:hypothetical protein